MSTLGSSNQTTSRHIFLVIPPSLGFYLIAVSANLIHPLVKSVELWKIFNMPSDGSVKQGIRLIERANPDAIAAARIVL